MIKAKEFLLLNFVKSFLVLFLPFFVIISLIYLIKLSNLASKVVLNLIDFSTLYFYLLPDIIFSTIPLTFIGALLNTFSKLSKENEMIALFSLGYSPLKIIKFFIPLGLFFSLFLTILSIYLTPYINQKMNNFKVDLIYGAKLKILPKKLSQSFTKKDIFIEKNLNGKFRNIIIFSHQKNGFLQILLAKSGEIIQDANSRYLNLNRGSLYRYRDKNFKIIDFENMKIYNQQEHHYTKFLKPLEFWKKNKNRFFYYLLISISPISILMILISLGVYNPRDQKNLTSIYTLFTSLLVYVPAIIAKSSANLYITIAIVILWITVSLMLFKLKLKRY